MLEDELLVALDIAAALSRLGCTVVGPASRVPAALRLAREEPLDGAILDVNVAGQPSFDVADELNRRGVPFVFATGYGRASLPEAHRQRVCLEKPMSREDIGRVVDTVFSAPLMREPQD